MPRALLADLDLEDLALALQLAGACLHAQRDGPWFVRRHVVRFAGLLVEGGELDLPRGRFLHVAGKTAWLALRELPAVPLPRLVRREGPAGSFDLAAWQAGDHPARAAVDADRLGAEATVRLLRPQERFTPLGSGGPTQVRTWLARQGLPAFVRRGQLMVVGANGVAWVVGRRLDRGHAITKETRRVAILELG